MRVLQNTVPNVVECLGFTPEGKLVAGGSQGFDAWGLGFGEKVRIPFHKTRTKFDFAMGPLGRQFYHAASGSGCRVIPLDGTPARGLPGHPDDQHVLSVAPSPDGRRLVVGRGPIWNHRLECWDTGAEEWRLAWTHREDAPADLPGVGRDRWFTLSAAFAPDGAAAVVLERRRHHWLSLRGAADGSALAELAVPFEVGVDRPPLRFSPCGARLVAMSARRLDLWDVAEQKHLGWVRAPGSANFRALAVHPSGQFLATAGGEGAVRYWCPETLRELKSYKWGIGKLYSIAFSPDGTLGAAGSDKGRVVVWDVDD